jgi:hypothetical protein
MTQQTDAASASDDWTKSCLVDRLKRYLASIESQEDGEYDNRKYYNQAHYMLKIGAYKPVPPYTVDIADISPILLKNLHSLDSEDRQFVLKQAVGRIFEDINPELYHNSISRVLWVKLQ